MSRLTSLLMAFAAAYALWAPAAGAHGGPHGDGAHASRQGADLAIPVKTNEGTGPASVTVATSRTPSGAAPVAAPPGCPADDGGPCCCRVDCCTATPESRVVAVAATAKIVAQRHAPVRPAVARRPIAITPFGTIGSVGSRGPPHSV